MNSEERERIKDALDDWVGRHPWPDEEVILPPGPVRYTARQIAYEVRYETIFGTFFLKAIDAAIEHRKITITEIIRDLRGEVETEPPLPQARLA